MTQTVTGKAVVPEVLTDLLERREILIETAVAQRPAQSVAGTGAVSAEPPVAATILYNFVAGTSSRYLTFSESYSII